MRKNYVYFITAAGVFLIVAVLLWKFLPVSEKNLSSSEAITDKSIAVLPFINDSPDPNNEYFCNGMMDVIITHLQKVGDLLVKSRTSVEQYRDRTKDVETIGKELKVAYVLEGSVGKIGDNYRINAQLIDTKTGNHLWAEYYDDKLTENIFEYQSNLAKKVAASLHAVLTPDERKRIEKRPTENAEAWDLIQKGFEMFWKQWGSDDPARVRQRAFNLFRKALEIDPDYSEAYGAIGYAYYMIDQPDSALIYLDKALLLDPENVAAYMAKGDLYRRKGNTDLAIDYLLKAVELAPNDVWSNLLLSDIYTGLNDLKKGLPYIVKLIKIDPKEDRNAYARIGMYFLNIGYFEKAEKYLWWTLTRFPGCLVQEYSWLKAAQGKFDEAQHFLDSICPLVDCDFECIPIQFYVYYSQEKYNEVEQFFIHWAESPLKRGHRGPLLFSDSLYFANVLLQLGKKQEAYFIINKCKALSEKHISEEPNRSDLNLDLATIHAFRDEKEESLIYLSKAVDLGLDWRLYYTPFDPSFKNLWNDPEFKAIIKRDQDKKAAVRAEIKKMEERGEINL